MTTATQIRNKLKDLLATITVANGYSRTLDASHIHKYLDRRVFDQKDTKLYPKMFIVVDGGDVTPEVSRRVLREMSFLLIYVDKDEATEATGSPMLQERTEAVIEDVVRLFATNVTLDGLADLVNLSSFVTDGGVLYPEASATFRLDVTYHDQY